jgi:hypothetical protein
VPPQKAVGLAAALTASLRAAGPAGALAGVVLLLAGLVAGYLAAGAVQLHALTGATTVPRRACRAGDRGRTLDADRGGPRGSRRTGADLHRRRRKGAGPEAGPKSGPWRQPQQGPGPDPETLGAARRSPGRVPCPIMGKLTTVANRIVDRGELCLPGEGASLSEHSVVLIRPDAPGSRGRQVLGQFVPEPA